MSHQRDKDKAKKFSERFNVSPTLYYKIGEWRDKGLSFVNILAIIKSKGGEISYFLLRKWCFKSLETQNKKTAQQKKKDKRREKLREAKKNKKKNKKIKKTKNGWYSYSP